MFCRLISLLFTQNKLDLSNEKNNFYISIYHIFICIPGFKFKCKGADAALFAGTGTK